MSATITVHQSASDAIWRVATLGAKMVVNTAHFVHIFCPATTECLLARRRPGAGESNSRFPVYLRVRTAEKLRHARAVCQLHCQRDGHKAWPLVVKATRTHLCKGAPCHCPLPFPPPLEMSTTRQQFALAAQAEARVHKITRGKKTVVACARRPHACTRGKQADAHARGQQHSCSQKQGHASE